MSDEKPLPLKTRGLSTTVSAVPRLPSVKPEPEANPREDWNVYLSSLARPRGPLTSQHAKHVRRFWHSLRSQLSPDLPVPQAGPTEAPGLLLVWDRDRHHLEVEIFQDGTYDWFYRDRRSEAYLGDEGLAAEARPQELVEHLRGFCNGSS